jgi:ABC-type Zn uptake system ZnuABC Zn-binding protein ZnuA
MAPNELASKALEIVADIAGPEQDLSSFSFKVEVGQFVQDADLTKAGIQSSREEDVGVDEVKQAVGLLRELDLNQLMVSSSATRKIYNELFDSVRQLKEQNVLYVMSQIDTTGMAKRDALDSVNIEKSFSRIQALKEEYVESQAA